MIRGYALALTLAVLGAALFAGWYSTTRTFYFAPSLFKQTITCEDRDWTVTVIDEFEADWFGGELRKFDEPSLYLASLEGDPGAAGSLRFTWLRSFADPIVIRVDRLADGSARVTAKQRARGFGDRPESRTRQVTRRLTPVEIEELDEVLGRTAALKQPPRICDGGADGAWWIIEAAGPSTGYVYVNRWTPRDGPVRELGLHLLELTGWRIADVY